MIIVLWVIVCTYVCMLTCYCYRYIVTLHWTQHWGVAMLKLWNIYYHMVLRWIHNYIQQYGSLQKILSSASWTVHKGSFVCNIATHFILCAQMDCIIIYYITNVFICELSAHGLTLWTVYLFLKALFISIYVG